MPTLLLRDVRLAFHKGVFEKTAFGGDPKAKADYNAKFIFAPDHPQIGELVAAEKAAAKEKWGAKAPDHLKIILAKDQGLIHDGDTQRSDGFQGNKYVSARSDARPSTYHRDRSQVTAEDGVIYSGCYVNAKFEVWAQDNAFGKRINARLLGVQFVRDGDSFSAGAPPADADDFPELDAGGDNADDPFA